jgi:dihydrofolate synthase/folylpolyglutamate synthase
MPLAGILERLYARRRFGIRPGIQRVRTLLDRLGNPEQGFRGIHVVGTNGKGSTAAFLSSILTAAGHRTALFTSPHLVNFRERFRMGGREPDDGQLAGCLDRVLSLAPDDATFFEIVTALGALLFAEEGMELAVMEAGMGGSSDATAALTGVMTVITPISLDHCDYLGDSLEKIAAEKGAIVEPGTPVIISRQPDIAAATIRSFCRCGESPLFRAGTDFNATWSAAGTLEYSGIHGFHPRLRPGIPGRYQAENASLALAAAETLDRMGIGVPETALATGLANARWPGRMELFPGPPRLLLDGAHNQAGADALADALGDYSYGRLLLVAGVMADKDVPAIMAHLAPLAARAYCVTPAMERAMADRELAGVLTGLGCDAIASGSVARGIAAARNEARNDDLILVCGSLFTVGEARAGMTGERFEGIRG